MPSSIYPTWVQGEYEVSLRRVAPNLWIGGRKAKRYGRFVAIVDLYGLNPHPQAVVIPFADGCQFPAGSLERIEEITRAYRQHGPVLIHCQAGLSRSASAAVAMLLREGVGLREAIRRVQAGTGKRHLPRLETLASAVHWAGGPAALGALLDGHDYFLAGK